MASLAFLMLGWGALGLTIESDSPDAHCPPITEVQQAVQARVGDVQGGVYEVRYGLVRDAQTGQNSVALVLRDAESAEVLRRNIPVSDDNCSDVALAIAVILERYFAGVIRTPASPPEQAAESEPEQGQPPDEERDEPPAQRRREGAPETAENAELSGGSERRASATPGPLFLRGALGLDHRTAPVGHLALGFHRGWWSLVSELSLAPFLVRSEEEPFLVRSSWYGVQLGVLFTPRVSDHLLLSLGPYFGAGIEVAKVQAPNVTIEGTRSRGVPTLGGALGLDLSLSSRTLIGAWVHGTALMGGTRFIVQDGEEKREVAGLPKGQADVSLAFTYRF